MSKKIDSIRRKVLKTKKIDLKQYLDHLDSFIYAYVHCTVSYKNKKIFVRRLSEL